MKVVVYPSGEFFHASTSCGRVQLATGVSREVEVTDIPVRYLTPCKVCFPDAPRQGNYKRPWCAKCDSRRACRHNGGVLVTTETTIKNYTHESYAKSIGRKVINTQWVFPDSRTLLAKHLDSMVS